MEKKMSKEEKSKNTAAETSVPDKAAENFAQNTAAESVGQDNVTENCGTSGEEKMEDTAGDEMKFSSKKAKAEFEKIQTDFDDLNDKYLRMIAEYDNFRKRALKDRDSAYSDAYADALKNILPVIDNLERAAAFPDSGTPDSVKILDGVKLTLKAFHEALEKMGVEEIKSEGEKFDPNLHNAVMHVEDDEIHESTVIEVFQKGYKKGDKIIRYAMVKVAN